jgi:hypothetical protein
MKRIFPVFFLLLSMASSAWAVPMTCYRFSGAITSSALNRAGSDAAPGAVVENVVPVGTPFRGVLWYRDELAHPKPGVQRLWRAGGFQIDVGGSLKWENTFAFGSYVGWYGKGPGTAMRFYSETDGTAGHFDGKRYIGQTRIRFADPLESVIAGDFTAFGWWGGGERLSTEGVIDSISRGAAPVPEPGTISLLLAGMAGAAAFRKRKSLPYFRGRIH